MGDGGNKQGRSSGGGWRGSVMTLLVIAAILWGFLFFACRTKSGIDFVQGRASARLGLDVTVERVTLLPPLTLRLSRVQSTDFEANVTGFHADEINVRFGLKPRVTLDLLRPELHLLYDGSVWCPTNLAALGDLPFRDLGGLSDVCAPWRGRMSITLDGGNLYWHGYRDSLIASARGVAFSVRPVKLPGHGDAFFHRLRAASVVEPAGRQTDNIVVDWLSVGEKRYIELQRATTLPAGKDAGFWGMSDDGIDGG